MLVAMFLIMCMFVHFQVTIKGVVLLNVSLSREVVPAFARILMRTSLGKKHLVRPLLQTEIIQVVNRRAWYDATKLTTEILSLYKVCSCLLPAWLFSHVIGHAWAKLFFRKSSLIYTLIACHYMHLI
jgi:hypothetical protein